MRLLMRNPSSSTSAPEFCFTDNENNAKASYAILSHTWGKTEDELTYADIIAGTGKEKPGYQKLLFCSEQAARDGLELFWIDTCCINKPDYTELHEAINSMFKWYRDSTKCYALLSDVTSGDNLSKRRRSGNHTWEADFRRSRWFTRGWTLQELLAPSSVEFFSRDGVRLGNKNSLKEAINAATKISTRAIENYTYSSFTDEERFSWAENRKTKKPEDGAYSLFGLFQVHISLFYGEGREKAFKRLKAEIRKPYDEHDRHLSKLVEVEDASFNSYRMRGEPKCFENTRVQLRHEIQQWYSDPSTPCIFWLSGMAGTGKSTIARTVGEIFSRRGCLAASFFFARGEGDLQHAKYFFSTLARQLARVSPSLRAQIAEAASMRENISSRLLGEQWMHLIVEPFQKLKGTDKMQLVFVVDALDECENADDIRNILKLFSQANGMTEPRPRIFVTSRPESAIRTEFRQMKHIYYRDLVLHDVPLQIVEKDIKLVLRSQLEEIRQDHNLIADWPKDTDVDLLTRKACGLFIYARTVCEFIKDEFESPVDRLQELLEDTSPISSAHEQLDDLYLQVLRRCVRSDVKAAQRANQESRFKLIVGSIICAFDTLSAKSLAALLNLEDTHVELPLRHLHSLLQVPESDNAIRLIHPSFRDFLLDEQRCSNAGFHIQAERAHCVLAKASIDVMNKSLRKDICNLDKPGFSTAEISDNVKQAYIPGHLRYACQHWVQHLQQALNIFRIDYGSTGIRDFLSAKFLYWLEAMIIIGRLSEMMHGLKLLEQLSLSLNDDELLTLVKDAGRLTLKFRSVIEPRVLQIYHAAIVFSPSQSIIKACFTDDFPSYLERIDPILNHWTASRSTLEGHCTNVTPAAFSPDGKLVASGSWDETVRLWNTETGAIYAVLKGHRDFVAAVAFSPDGNLVASASWDTIIRLWDVGTGTARVTLEGHSDRTTSVVFSRNGKLIASGSFDGTVRIWSTETGTEYSTLRGHIQGAGSFVFSPDSKLLAYSFSHTTVGLFHLEMNAIFRTLTDHSLYIDAIVFSPDGKLLAAGSRAGTVHIWDVETGGLYGTLEGYHPYERAIAFSPDSTLVAYGCTREKVRLWNTETSTACGELEGPLRGPAGIVFSPDGRLLASVCLDYTISLWDIEIGELRGTLKGHSATVHSIVFSPNSKLVASGSDDGTLRLWDVEMCAYIAPEAHSTRVTKVVFSPNGKLVVSGSSDGSLRLWDAETGIAIAALDGATSGMLAFAISPDNHMVVCGSTDGKILRWDFQAGVTHHRNVKNHGRISAIASLPQRKMEVYGCWDGTLVLWDIDADAARGSLKGHFSPVKLILFSPDAKLMASLSYDRVMSLYREVVYDHITQEIVLPGGLRVLVHDLSTGDLAPGYDYGTDPDFLQHEFGYTAVDKRDGPDLQDDLHQLSNSTGRSVSLDESMTWIRLDGEDSLWLPAEIRPGAYAAHRNVLVLGSGSGSMTFLYFKDKSQAEC